MQKIDNLIMKQSLIEKKLDNHITEFHDYKKQDQQKWDEFIESQRRTNMCQEQNTESIKELIRTTSDVVELYRTGQAVVKAGSWFGRFIKWLTGIAVVGASISYIANHLPWN